MLFQVRKLDNHRCEHEKGCADHPTQPTHFTGKGERPKEVRGLTQTIRAASIKLETGTQVPTQQLSVRVPLKTTFPPPASACSASILLKGPAGGCPSCPSKGFIHQGRPQALPAYYSLLPHLSPLHSNYFSFIFGSFSVFSCDLSSW